VVWTTLYTFGGVSEKPQNDSSYAPQVSEGDTEEVDAVVAIPVGAAFPVGRTAGAVVPAVQAAAVAATGFVAGAALMGLARRHRHRRELVRVGSTRRLGRRTAGARGRRSSRGAGELVQIVGSRSLLVDVHLLGGRN
jgi:hypothetical protein